MPNFNKILLEENSFEDHCVKLCYISSIRHKNIVNYCVCIYIKVTLILYVCVLYIYFDCISFLMQSNFIFGRKQNKLSYFYIRAQTEALYISLPVIISDFFIYLTIAIRYLELVALYHFTLCIGLLYSAILYWEYNIIVF